MEKNLTEIDLQKEYKILKIDTHDQALLLRYYNFGLVEGQSVAVLRVSPKNATYLIAVRGYALAVDKTFAQRIVVYA